MNNFGKFEFNNRQANCQGSRLRFHANVVLVEAMAFLEPGENYGWNER